MNYTATAPRGRSRTEAGRRQHVPEDPVTRRCRRCDVTCESQTWDLQLPQKEGARRERDGSERPKTDLKHSNQSVI